MSELKPCPFCGSSNVATEKSLDLAYCDNCCAESNDDVWNTRPIEDALNARIAELEAGVAELKRQLEIAVEHEITAKVRSGNCETIVFEESENDILQDFE